MGEASFLGRQFLTEFIELYKENTCLWKVKSKEYLDRNKKGQAYGILVTKMKEKDPTANRETVTKKINSMRTAFRKEMKKVADSIMSGAKADDIYHPTLWYFELLRFLKDQETPGQSVSNLKEEVSSPPDVKSDAGTLYIDDLDDPLIRPSSVSSCQAPVKSVGGKKRGRQDACDNLLALIGKRLQSSRTEDEFDIVGKNLSNKLRRLCRKQQLFAERLMNEVVFEGELGNLNRSSKIVVQAESKDSVKELQNTPAPSSNASR